MALVIYSKWTGGFKLTTPNGDTMIVRIERRGQGGVVAHLDGPRSFSIERVAPLNQYPKEASRGNH